MNWRHRKLANAEVSDIPRILAYEGYWSEENLTALAARVDRLSIDRPQEGYRLAVECVLPIAERVCPGSDVAARGWIAGATAARRLGRLDDAEAFYRTAADCAMQPTTRGIFHQSLATLRIRGGRLDAGLRHAQRAVAIHAAEGDQSELASAWIVHGNARNELAIRADDPAVARQALADYREAIMAAAPGSPEQLIALANFASVLFHTSLHQGGSDLTDAAGLLVRVRQEASARRWCPRARHVMALADWSLGKIACRLGSPLKGRRDLIKAGRMMARLGHHLDALRITADLVEAEHEVSGDLGHARLKALRIVEDVPRVDETAPALDAFEAIEQDPGGLDALAGFRDRIDAAAAA